MATLHPGIGLKRYKNLLVVIKQTAYEEYSQVSSALEVQRVAASHGIIDEFFLCR